MHRQIPEYFAILRDGYRGPTLQVLQAIPSNDGYGSHRNTFEIVNSRRRDEYIGELAHAPYHITNDGNIHTLRYLPAQGEEPQEVYYWFTPFALDIGNAQGIPLLEFQYRSWIPTGHVPLPVRANLNELFATLHRIQETQLVEIRRREDEASMGTPRYSRAYNRIHTPPRVDSWNRNSRHLRTPSPPPRIVETVRLVEVPVERVVIQNKPLPIPKAVGDLLLSNARKGADTCPILQTPFSECTKLAVSSCFHIFDAESLSMWQQTHTSCPVCRCKLENVVSE
jgi:hypothetical protein